MASLTRKVIRGRSYYYLRECQRVGGKPKIVWTHYLGSAERLVERLCRPEPQEVSVVEFGASAAALGIAQALGVVEAIDRHVPKHASQGPTVGQYLLLAALNRCVEPRSKAQLADWHRRSALRRLLPMTEAQLTSQRFWDNMNRVGAEQIVAIERDLSAAAVSRFGLDLRCLLFDATNFFTFVDSFNTRATLPQRGHSKEGRANLRIIGLALLVTADGDVPLFHHTYAGNQHDAVTFHSVTDELVRRSQELAGGACDITLVFDKGNNSTGNLNDIENSPLHFVGSLVPTQHADLLAIPLSQMQRLPRQRLPAVWAARTRKKVFGVERTIVCTFNRRLFVAQTKTLQREIRKRRHQLDDCVRALEQFRARPRGKKPTVASTRKRVEKILAARHMKQLFHVEVHGEPNEVPMLCWRFEVEAWKRLRSSLLGKTILFTDRDDWTDEQIVLAYRAQHHVEAAFRRMKDPRFLTFRPTFHWTDQKLRVHAFYCVLALMILSLLRRTLAQHGINISVARMTERLADIREVTLLYPAPPRARDPFARNTLSTMDEQQRSLFDVLGLKQYWAS